MKTKLELTRNRILVVVVALIFSIGMAYAENGPTITKTFKMSEPGSLNSSSSGGGITVTAHAKAEVIVQAFVRKRGVVLSPTDNDVKEVLEAYDLVIKKNGNEITATAKRKMRGNFWNNTGIYFKIFVPKEMSCNVSSSGGSIKISGVVGTHIFTSSGGSVKLENTGGNTKATSSGGKVQATKHKGDIYLKSSGGGVYVDKAKGKVSAYSSGGSVKLNGIYGDVDAGSSGGGVSVSGECPYVKATSSGGSVKINISKLSKELYLKSSGGGVSAIIHDGDKLGLDLDLVGGRVNMELQNFSGKSEKNRVKGRMNNGGIPVYMRASGGNVNVEYED